MTKIKLCGLKSKRDIEVANGLSPQYIGFVFAEKSKRYVTPEKAKKLKELLDPEIKAVGVFVDEEPEMIAELLREKVIDMAQLHGSEDESFIRNLRGLTDKPIIKAFKIKTDADMEEINACTADYVLLDSGAGTGETFDWDMIKNVNRPYFLAGGLNPDNVEEAIARLRPFAVDVSSGIETDGIKDERKMTAFVKAVGKEN